MIPVLPPVAAAGLVSGLAKMIEHDSKPIDPERVFRMYNRLTHAKVRRDDLLKSIAAELESRGSLATKAPLS